MTKDQSDRIAEDGPGAKSVFQGIPQRIVNSFLEGLDDVKHGRTVSIDSALAEGRRRIAEFRLKKNKNDTAKQQRESPIP